MDLTPRERQVLESIALGFMNKEIADRLAISTKTVEKYRENIRQKTGLTRVANLTMLALQMNLVQMQQFGG